MKDLMKSEQKLTPGLIVVYIVLTIWGILTVTPFVWVLNSSFKTGTAVTTIPFALPFGQFRNAKTVSSNQDSLKTMFSGKMVSNDNTDVSSEGVDGENVDGENVDGENVDGENVDGENVDGENVDGEDTGSTAAVNLSENAEKYLSQFKFDDKTKSEVLAGVSGYSLNGKFTEDEQKNIINAVPKGGDRILSVLQTTKYYSNLDAAADKEKAILILKIVAASDVPSRAVGDGFNNYPSTKENINKLNLEAQEKLTGNTYSAKFILGGKGGIIDSYKNSLVISFSVMIFVMLIAGMCAYGLARYDIKLGKHLVVLIIASMMFPVFSTIIPVNQLEASMGLTQIEAGIWKNLLAVILPQIAGNIAFSVTVLMGFIKSLPIDMEEAAYLEGYSIYRIYFQIILPLSRPAFATVAIFTFLWSYNDLFTQRRFVQPINGSTITMFLSTIMTTQGRLPNFGQMCAAVVVIILPVLVAYIFLQKNIVKGLTAGAVKG